MDESIRAVKEFYDAKVENEWTRIANRPEFLLTCRMFDRYIKPGDKVIDIGGGPGRYSLYLAEKGCEVTLLDLSPENANFAARRASEQGLSIKVFSGDARGADKIISGCFDHVLLMGPMYHLLDENDRKSAVNAALGLLKKSGILYVSFINLFAIIIYYMKQSPEKIVLSEEAIYIKHAVSQQTYAGDAFTKAVFADQSEILPFMAQFPLEKLHFFGQEGIISPCEGNIMSQPQNVIDSWLDLCEKVWERKDLLSWSEHLMYVGRKYN